MTHGHCSGGRVSPERKAFENMLTRCRSTRHSSYAIYGGRGIGICDRWKLFTNFLADMGLRPSPQHTLDRADSNKDYGPDNCRWATRKVQNRNRNCCHFLTHASVTRTIAEWSEVLGIKAATISMRIQRGWTGPQALGFERR
jgi:hypothetical protein